LEKLNRYGGKNSLNYHNLTNLAETTLSQAKEMSVVKDTERAKWDVVKVVIARSAIALGQALIRPKSQLK
jgi:hypothetical protein